MKHLSIIRVLVVVFCWIIVAGCGSARATIEELRKDQDALRMQLNEANAQIIVLREKNAQLTADLKGGRPAEEWSDALNVKEASLNQREQELLERKNGLDERELTLRQRESSLDEKLDSARREGIDMANRWLVAFFVALALTFLSVIASIIFWIRSRTPVVHRNEPVRVLTPKQALMLEAIIEKHPEESS
jgi:hypothetical protein